GICVPGGFGIRGIEGKIEAIRIAREEGIPFLGLCLGLQCAVIEYARNVAGLDGANSSEFDQATPHPVIDLLPGQESVDDKGGTMRLGLWPAKLAPGSAAHERYGDDVVYERHRHRYEVNPAYHRTLEGVGLRFSGISPDGRLAEIIELPGHPGAAAVVPLKGGAVLLVRQNRHAVGSDLLEIPAGKLDVPGEDPADCARRELKEETGYEAGVLEALGVFYSSPGFTDERFHL